MTVSDRWNRVRQRPHTRIFNAAGDDDSEVQEVIEGGAYDPGLPMSVPASRNTRNYKRAIARTMREQTPPGRVISRPVPGQRAGNGEPSPGKARATIRQDPDVTGQAARQNPRQGSVKPPVTIARARVNLPGPPGTGPGDRPPSAIAAPPSQVEGVLSEIVRIYTARYCEFCGNEISLDAPAKKRFCCDNCRINSFKAGKRRKAQARSEAMTPGNRKYFTKGDLNE